MAREIPKTVVVGTAVTVVVLLALYLLTKLPSGGETAKVQSAGSRLSSGQVSFTGGDKCATCHQRVTPDIVYQYATSTMAKSGVKCEDCHIVNKNNSMGHDHEGFFITSEPTPKQCGKCHVRETDEFEHSRHAGPAWMALTGFDDFSPEQQKLTESIPELTRGPNGIPTATRNAIFDMEGPNVTPAACQSCHAIGKPNKDGSIGNCNKCHLRHEFSLAQVRKPEVCGQCHLGPDHPQEEIYKESAHGVMYATEGQNWNWNQKAGRLTTRDMPAPTCATCHMSGFGGQGTTHEVGTRLTKFLFAAISTDRPNGEQNRRAMQGICANCHSQPFIKKVYQRADSVTSFVNVKVKEASDIIAGLIKDKVITSKPFATQISYDAFDLWHYYGRTAKFAAYMQGPDYVQWHGVYPLLRQLNKVKEDAARLRAEHRSGAKR
ncbi:MAG: nitrate reductase [Bacteroidetes bacterium]|nr:nitrate reductase [Bacteroidota bacterium]MCL5737023.1 nitrate reductase [Bacteroidota bacterium]